MSNIAITVLMEMFQWNNFPLALTLIGMSYESKKKTHLDKNSADKVQSNRDKGRKVPSCQLGLTLSGMGSQSKKNTPF